MPAAITDSKNNGIKKIIFPKLSLSKGFFWYKNAKTTEGKLKPICRNIPSKIFSSRIERYISKKAIVKNLNSEDITEKIILPGRFKRIYVEKGNGKVFLGGKEINQLDPSSKKFLSIKKFPKLKSIW